MYDKKIITEILKKTNRAVTDFATDVIQIFQEVLNATHLNRGQLLLKVPSLERFSQQYLELTLEKKNNPLLDRLEWESQCLLKPFSGVGFPSPNRLFPIIYRKEKIGEISIEAGATFTHEQVLPFFENLAHELAYWASRYEIREKAHIRFGKEAIWLGHSARLRDVEKFMERASSVEFPIMIVGKRGTEKTLLAQSLHLLSPRWQGPFVEVRCGTFQGHSPHDSLKQYFEQAQGGTLFLKEVDALSPDSLDFLLNHWEQFMPAMTTKATPVPFRMIVSLTRDSPDLARSEKEGEALWRELDILRIHLPALQLRREDIQAHFHFYLEKYSGSHPMTFQDEVIDVFENYRWPENVKELERAMVKLVSLSETETIRLSDLYALVPELMENWSSSEQTDDTLSVLSENTLGNSALEGKDAILIPADHIAKSLAEGEQARLEATHPQLLAALEYLGEHYHEDITLGELASNAFISPSHLSYLLKSSFGKSFKQFHTQIRVERAKVLLGEQPYKRVTDVSLEVGYRDLSHFEKTFKRIVGLTPKHYRQKFLS